MSAQLEVRVHGGFRLRLNTSDAIGRVLVTSGEWEPNIAAVFPALLRPGDTCVDVGANIGYYSLLAAQIVGPSGRVYAVEPEPNTYGILLSNIELNDAANVTPFCVAAGAAAGEVVLNDRPRGQSGLSSVRRAGETLRADIPADLPGIRVPVQTVASLIPPSEFQNARLIKVDAEGYEEEVLRGVEPLLDCGARPALIVELHVWRADEIVELLRELIQKYELTAYRLPDRVIRHRTAWWTDHALDLDAPLAVTNGMHVLLASPQ